VFKFSIITLIVFLIVSVPMTLFASFGKDLRVLRRHKQMTLNNNKEIICKSRRLKTYQSKVALKKYINRIQNKSYFKVKKESND
jgi:lipopolysaccharide/colanic/teichoic acid biosynthesis glycosyltransferase